MRSVSRLVSVLLFAVCTVTLSAKPYIVVLSGKSPVTPATMSATGGSVIERFADHLIVDLPPDGVELLCHDPGVKYLELIGEAEPRSSEPLASNPSRARIEAWTPPAWSSGAYNYDGTGNIYAIGTASSPASDGTRNTYTYDLNSRLATWTGPGSWSESYTYDEYGNMTAKTMGASTMNMPVTTATNHLTAESYDTAGNRTSSSTSPSHAYAYDSVNMIVKDQEGASAANWYVYTADDERIGVLSGDNWTWSLRGSDHEVLRQFKSVNSAPSSAWTWVEDYVYRGSQLLASERVPEEGGRRQFHLDHLGTPRMITSPSGVLIALHDLTPFGSDMSQCNQETGVGFDREEPRRFTGHERDFAADGCDLTALDYIHARQYNGVTARFLSVDRLDGAAGAPQTWNRYAYALNSPIRKLDVDGRDAADGLTLMRIALIGYLLKPYFDPKVQVGIGSAKLAAKLLSPKIGIKGANYVGVNLTNTLTRGNSANTLDITVQAGGLGGEAVITFHGAVPVFGGPLTVDELYAMAGPFEKSIFHDVSDKFSTGIGIGGSVTVDQKLDQLLPALFEAMASSTPELVIQVEQELESQGYQIIDGQLVLVMSKAKTQ